MRLVTALPLTVCLVVTIWLPEPVYLLLLRQPRAMRTQRLVSRILPALPAGARIITAGDGTSSTPIGSLVAHGRTPETVLIWVAFEAVSGAGAGQAPYSSVCHVARDMAGTHN